MQRPAVLLTLLVLGLLANCRGEPRSPYVGLRHGPLPAGVSEATGVLLDPLDGVRYGTALVNAPEGPMLWLNRQVGEREGRPLWEVLDVLPVPPIPRGEQLVLGLCRRGGVRDPELAAVVVREEGVEWWGTVRKAWRADRRAGRFEPVRTEGVECENEGYGAGG